jgi:hypothetical protein
METEEVNHTIQKRRNAISASLKEDANTPRRRGMHRII